MKKWMIACMALLLATACKDEIDHSGEVHATAVELYSVEVTTAMFAAEMYGDGITERGICWSEEQNPTTADSKITDAGTGAGAFTTQITGLEPSTTYYVRAYAIAHGDAEHPYYSSQFEFTTCDELTAAISSATASLDYIVAEFTVAGGVNYWIVKECGIAYGTSANPTVANGKASIEIKSGDPDRGDFSVTASNLREGVTYYLRPFVSYATDVDAPLTTVYGEQTSVKTLTQAELRQLFVDRLEAKQLTYGSIYQSGKFTMHYSLDLDADQVTVSYIDAASNKDVKHVTVPMSFNDDYSKLEWTSVTSGSTEFAGIGLDGATFNLYPLGSADMQFQASMTSDEIYSIFVKSDFGGISRVSELRRGEYHPSVPQSIHDVAGNCTEFNGGNGGFITCPGAYLLFKNATDNTGKPIIPVTKDVATFTFGEYTYPYGGSLTDDQVKAVEEGLKPVTDILYDTDGVIIVKETVNTLTPKQGGFYYYMLSSKGTGWLKWYLRVYGQ